MNTKMKTLSLALVALTGFAGSAMAACPAGPTTADGGAWTSATELPSHAASPASVVAGGLDGSPCKLTVSLSASTTAASFVRYTHAASEPNYRFQFLVDTTALSAASGSTDSVTVFQAPAATLAHGFNRLLSVNVVPGAAAGTRRLRFVAQTGAGSFTTGANSPADLAGGIHRVEGKLTVGAGAAGAFSYWIDAAAGTTEPAATGSIANLDNLAWGGVKAANLGLTGPTSAYATAHGGQALGFDTFDSRRNTYIGH